MARDPGLTRHKPLRQSQIEETIMVRQATKRTAPKKVQKNILLLQNKHKLSITRRKLAKKPRMSTREFCKRGIIYLVLLILIQVNIPIPDGLSTTGFDRSSSNKDVEIIEIENLSSSLPPSPQPTPKLPLLKLVIILVINGKEISERNRKMDPNEDFDSFDF